MRNMVPVLPGCFASALCAQEASETCRVCSVKEQCFQTAQEREADVLKHVTRKLKVRGLTDDMERILHYLSARKRSDREVAKSGNARSDTLLKRFADERIDLGAIKFRQNPFDRQRQPMFYHMAAFVAQGIPFKPKDMTEYVQEHGDLSITTSSLASEVARFASALVAAGILERKEKRILCLAP